jgi:trigger factor
LTTTIHERSEVGRELEIFIDEAELQKAFDVAYKSMRPRLSLPGFRPGKAPISLVKRLHGDAIEGDALEKLAEEKFREVAEENKIEMLGSPVMTDLHRHPGEGAHFKIAYEISPAIDLKDFSEVEVEKRIIPIKPEDIDRMIERMRFRRATREPADTIENDQAVVRLSFAEANDTEGATPKTSEEEAFLADPDILPELKDKLIGHKAGDVIRLELPTRSNKTGEPPGEEKPQMADVTILEIEKVTLPELTEEFIKDISMDRATNIEELRDVVGKELEDARTKASDEDLEERIVQKLLELHPFEVPRAISNAILDQMIEEKQQDNVRHGFPATYALDDAEFRERNRPIAEARGKWTLLRQKLIESEGLEATDEDLEKLAEEESAKYGLTKENLLKYYHKHDSIQNRIVSDKLGAMLREKVKVVETTV